MIIKPIEDKEGWDGFVQKQPFYTFINSWDWGEFNKLMGSKIYRMGFYDDGGSHGVPHSAGLRSAGLRGLALIIKVEARRGTHLFCPYGPMFDIAERGQSPFKGDCPRELVGAYFKKLKEILPELIKLAKKEDACFLRIHPPICCGDDRDGALLRLYNTANGNASLSHCVNEGTSNQAGDCSTFTMNKGMNVPVETGHCPVSGFRSAPIHVHAEDTWLLDLAKPIEKRCDYGINPSLTLPSRQKGGQAKVREIMEDEELLSNMRKTTRYIIKRAIKEGVKAEKNNGEEYIDKFIEMHKSHSVRDKGAYTAFSDGYIKNLFKAFPDEDINLMYAEYDPACHSDPAEMRGKNPVNYSSRQGILRVAQNDIDSAKNIEAMLVSIKYGKTTAYYLGASDIKHPKFSPAYLLQWEAIKKARDAGCEYYNFWGVSPDDNPKHPLSGVSLFKKGFGGYDYKLMHAQDLPLTSKYWLNWAVESMRRIRRGYYYKLKV